MVATKKQVNEVLVSKKGGRHENKKRKAEDSEIVQRIREVIAAYKEKKNG